MNWIVLTIYTFISRLSGNPVFEQTSLHFSSGQERNPLVVPTPEENNLNPYQETRVACHDSACRKTLTTDESNPDERSKQKYAITRRIRQPPDELP